MRFDAISIAGEKSNICAMLSPRSSARYSGFSPMPELRKDPITDSWVIISTDRARRPSDFLREPTASAPSGRFCPFCPGNESKTPPEVLAYRNGSGVEPARLVAARDSQQIPGARASKAIWTAKARACSTRCRESARMRL